MITDAIINLVTAALSAIFNLLPTGNLSSVLANIDSTLYTVGSSLSQWNSWFPFSEMLGALYILVTVVFPAIIVYKLANWTWRHIPDLWGFGPGAG